MKWVRGRQLVYITYVESKKVKLIEAETRKAERFGGREDVGQKVQTFSYKMNKFW